MAFDGRDRAESHLVVVRIDGGGVRVGLQQGLGDRLPLARVKSPSCDTTTCMPGHCLMASSKPFLRSIAGDAPVVPSSSMILALPPVALAICTAARLPSWTKSDWMTRDEVLARLGDVVVDVAVEQEDRDLRGAQRP